MVNKEFILAAKKIIRIKDCADGIIRCAICPLHLYDNTLEIRRSLNDVTTCSCSNMSCFDKSSEKIEWLKKWLNKYGEKEQFEFDF